MNNIIENEDNHSNSDNINENKKRCKKRSPNKI